MFSQESGATSDDDRDRAVLQQLHLLLQLLLLLPHIHELALQHILPPPSAILISVLLRVLRRVRGGLPSVLLQSCPHLVVVVCVLGLAPHQDWSQGTQLSQIVEILHFLMQNEISQSSGISPHMKFLTNNHFKHVP